MVSHVPSYLAALSLTQQASEIFDAEARINDAIAVVRPVAYRSRQVDWDAVAEDMSRRVEGARDDIDMLPAWAALAQGLGDGHSFVQPTPEAIAAWRERYRDRPLLPDAPPRPRPKSQFTKRTDIEAHTLAVGPNHDAALITVPSVSGFGDKAIANASRLFGAVADASPRTCGYVLDLRGNTRGNIWPMLIDDRAFGHHVRTRLSAFIARQFFGVQQGIEALAVEIAHDHLAAFILRRGGVGPRHGHGEAAGPGVAYDQNLLHRSLLFSRRGRESSPVREGRQDGTAPPGRRAIAPTGLHEPRRQARLAGPH
ncbi:Uncharacterised protein [Brevundimonas vancanneytii]|uniref:Peptidase family S41 n=1 Tax=Brevundimonas vancanneytii TaxID=1325724 RepID=A0A4P1KF30_9CAUL|nr:Uncharacterised protein [Brevundimonas vancanneytii]